jgi:hypothetical protein
MKKLLFILGVVLIFISCIKDNHVVFLHLSDLEKYNIGENEIIHIDIISSTQTDMKCQGELLYANVYKCVILETLDTLFVFDKCNQYIDFNSSSDSLLPELVIHEKELFKASLDSIGINLGQSFDLKSLEGSKYLIGKIRELEY